MWFSIFIPSSSFRVRLAISLISMRDSESECVAEMSGVGGTMAGAGVVSTLLTRGDLRGRSMLRPTKLHNGILKMCLHGVSPSDKKKCREGRRDGKTESGRRQEEVGNKRRRRNRREKEQTMNTMIQGEDCGSL